MRKLVIILSCFSNFELKKGGYNFSFNFIYRSLYQEIVSKKTNIKKNINFNFKIYSSYDL